MKKKAQPVDNSQDHAQSSRMVVQWPGSSTLEREVEVMWAHPEGPSVLVWGGGKVVEAVERCPDPSHSCREV
jgi:hypothetical protein